MNVWYVLHTIASVGFYNVLKSELFTQNIKLSDHLSPLYIVLDVVLTFCPARHKFSVRSDFFNQSYLIEMYM